jgi:hypothetical protein
MLSLLLVFLTASPEAELFEDDVTLPKVYTWNELLSELQAQPLDLNAATAGQLEQLPWLTPRLAQAIVAFRDSSQGFEDVSQLLQVQGMDSARWEAVRPYLIVVRTRRPVRVKAGLRAGLSGPPDSLSVRRAALTERFQLETSGLRVGLVADKDIGESDVLDFVAGGLSYQWRDTRVAAGNFELSSGQGLVLSRPDGNWVGSGSSLELRGEHLALPSAPAENVLLQGLLLGQGVGPVLAEVFVSRNRLDAAPGPDSGIRNINYSGVHDDSAGLANRRRLQEDLLGARLGLALPGLELALAGYGNRYAEPIVPVGQGFSGRSLGLVSGALDWWYQDYRLGCEVAHSLRYGWAGALKLLGDWRELKVRADLAYLQGKFYSPHSRSRILSRAHDELDGTLRLSYAKSGWGASLYGTTSRDFILDSMPARLQLSVENHSSPLRVGLQWRQSFKDESWRTGGARLDAGWKLGRALTLSARFDDRFVLNEPGKRGTAVSLGGDWSSGPVQLEARATRFHVTSSDCRVYAFESGLPGNNRALDGTGWRAFMLGRIRVASLLRLSAKLGLTATYATGVDAGLGLDASN